MTDITDEQFDSEVAALERKLEEGVTAINEELQTLHTQLNADLAAADQALNEFAKETEKGESEE